jgi:hypothetical protein
MHRVLVFEALDRRVRQFRGREELWPLRVPREPIPLEDVIEEALGEDANRFDPGTLRARTLLELTWEDGASWNAWMTALPSKTKLYCDSDSEETRILASGGRNEGEESDRVFLRLLAESGGGHFGIEMAGGAPSRVRSSIDDRAFLVEMFVELFEVTGTEGSVRRSPGRPASGDFQHEVEDWLAESLISSQSTTATARLISPRSNRTKGERE